MIKHYGSVLHVTQELGDQAKPNSRCQLCMRDALTTYPLMTLRACAPCIVVATKEREPNA